MDLKKAIQKEHSKKQCMRVVRYIGDDPARFRALIDLFFSGEYRITQRAAWPLSYCVEKHPQLIRPYFKKIIRLLGNEGVHEAVTRNILRLLQYVEVPASCQGQLMTQCFEFMNSSSAPAAVKAFSLSILENLAGRYPDIRQELILCIEDQWGNALPSFRSRARKILKRFAIT